MIYDITQPLLECSVYPDDPVPQKTVLLSMDEGSLYNLSALSLCVHNGTHIDAPYHFIHNGKTIDQIPLEKFMGACYVHKHDGDITREDAKRILELAKGRKKILIKGDATVTLEAAKEFSKADLDLIGNESQSIGPINAPMAVHICLFSKEVVLLEGIRLESVEPGFYTLNCAPINITGSDGSPCRAVLIDDK